MFIKKIFYFFLVFGSSIAYFSSCEKEDLRECCGMDPLHDTVNDTIVRVDTVCLKDTICLKDTVKDTVYIEENPHIIHPEYPSSKIWYHGANYASSVAERSMKFEGLELDINYSSATGKMYVCHNIEDTIKSVTLEEWFEILPDPTRNWYWFDMKNLTVSTADELAVKIDEVVQKYGIKEKIWIEYYDVNALRIIKNYGFNTILTVENLNSQVYSEYVWQYFLLGKINTLKPSAIGCDYTMANLLNRYFSDQEIFLWHSTIVYTDEYAAETRALCSIPSVKVVLVDYNEPITY